MEPSAAKQMLLDRVEADREMLVAFLRGFLRARSPNPPGDTREATRYITDYLDGKRITYDVVGPDPEKPNIVSSFKSQVEGKRLILNGHIDVFPVGTGEGWSHTFILTRATALIWEEFRKNQLYYFQLCAHMCVRIIGDAISYIQNSRYPE